MKMLIRCLTTALAAAVLSLGMAPVAEAHGYGYRGGYRGGYGPGWGAVGLGLGLGVGLGWLAGSRYGYSSYSYGPPVYSSVIVPAYPSYVYVDPPSVVYREVPAPVYREVPRQEPVAKAPPEPIIYPRNGQNAQQLEADRQECNRWATTQPSAMADSSVFNRATEACMDGRGYTMR
jgi:hypothetical protein